MRKKPSRYVIKLDPAIAGAVGELCPQESIGCSLSKFIEIQLNALERGYFDLTDRDHTVSLPVEILDILELFYPCLPVRGQIICAVRTLADLVCSDNDSGIDVPGDLAGYREIADLQRYYATGGVSED